MMWAARVLGTGRGAGCGARRGVPGSPSERANTMTVRGKILLFAAVAVGLVAVVGGALFALATRGRLSTEQVFAMQEQNTLYGKLAGDAVWVPHSLLEARGKGQAFQDVLEAEQRRAEVDFSNLRE